MLISQESADLIANEISVIMHKPAFLTDGTARIISSTQLARVGGTHMGAQAVVEQGLEFFVLPCDTEAEICFPIIINDHIMGVVGIVDDWGNTERIITYYGEMIRRIAEVRIQRLSRRMSHDEEQLYFDHARQIFFESTLFSDTLSEYLSDEETIFRASLLGIDLAQPRMIVVLGFETDSSRGAEGAVPQALSQKNLNDFSKYLKQHITFHRQNFCFADEQRVILLFCSDAPEQVQETTTRLCEDLENFYSIKIHGGISSVAKASTHLRRCYNEAKMACLMAQKMQKKMLLTYNVTSPYFIARSMDAGVQEMLVSSVFQGVDDDERREMVQIIQTYCDADGNVEQAAARLFVHRNTFLYRMNKIKALTGYSLKKPKDLFVLYLAMLLR